MASLNKMQVIGNLGRDPEMRYTPNGNPVTSFSIATNRAYTDSQGEKHEETEWFTVVAWNQLAELCNQYLSKGRRAYVDGRLRSSTWQGAGRPDQVSQRDNSRESVIPGPRPGRARFPGR